ncbi:hypothetical protein [Actinomyces howellii]|nr:hypothetical protein [Actinomyces howellii]
MALTRTSQDETSAALEPFEDLADVELIDVDADRDAAALISRLGVRQLPAWLYPLGEGMIIAVGAATPLVQRLRVEVAREAEAPEPVPERIKPDVGERARDLVLSAQMAAEAARDSQNQLAEERLQLSREHVMQLIDARADQLHPVTQVSRLSRRLNTPERVRTLNRNDTND